MVGSLPSAHRVVLLAVTTAIAASCSNSAAAGTGPTAAQSVRTIVALGDSLTSGHGLDAKDQAYPAVLERMLTASGLPFRVVNHGVSGDTTAGALRRLDAALGENPSILIVALGANDGLRGVAVSQVRANLEKIIETAQGRQVAVLLCGMEALPLNGWDYTLAFHGVFPELAEKYSVPLVPFLLQGVLANQDMLLPDLIHPNAAGAAHIARTIWPYLQPLALKITGTLTI
jgi:acyl-CoA thioesterase I